MIRSVSATPHALHTLQPSADCTLLKSNATMSAKMAEELEKRVPIAQQFHKPTPVAESDLIAPKKILLPFNAFLLFSQWLVFIIMLVYYSDPVSYVKESKLQIRWDWGKSGDAADSTPYNCTPIQTDEYWGHEFGYDTCKLHARAPDSTTVLAKTKIVGGNTYNGWYYKPYDFSDAYMNIHTNMFSHRYLGTTVVSEAVKTFIGTLKDPCDGNYDFSYHLDNPTEGYFVSKEGITHGSVTNRKANCVLTQENAIKRFKIFHDTIGAVEDNAAAQTTVAGWEPTDMVCAYAKGNIPFTCEREIPKPAMERISLAYANSLFIYSVFSAIVVQIFFSSSSLFTKKEDANKESAPASATNTV